MVRGIEKFREFFADYQESYLLIGGAACDIWMERAGLSFRVTKDLDIVLMFAALDRGFVKRFHDFVRAGKYDNRQASTGRRRYYRFFDPDDKGFPQMLELFSRGDAADMAGKRKVIPIPVEEDLSSLSAILMDESYYRLLSTQRMVLDGLALLSIPGLICLKMRAWLDLREKERLGELVDSRDIRKHKNDVFRLFLALRQESSIVLPQAVRKDVSSFLAVIRTEPWDVKDLAKKTGVTNPPSAIRVIELLAAYFGVE